MFGVKKKEKASNGKTHLCLQSVCDLCGKDAMLFKCIYLNSIPSFPLYVITSQMARSRNVCV